VTACGLQDTFDSRLGSGAALRYTAHIGSSFTKPLFVLTRIQAAGAWNWQLSHYVYTLLKHGNERNSYARIAFEMRFKF